MVNKVSTRIDPFPKPSALEKYQLSEIVEVAVRCEARQWCAATAGNFSTRGRAGIFWQSPSGCPKGRLQPEDFLAVELERQSPISPQSKKPSDEMPIHAAIYRRDPAARYVVHVHPPALVSKTLRASSMRFQGHEMAKAFGLQSHLQTLEIPILANTQQMAEFASQLEFMPLYFPVLVLRGHGVYSWSEDGYSALKFVEALEFLCQTSFHR